MNRATKETIMTTKTHKVAEIKKDEDGKLWVRWQGKRKFLLIQDNQIAEFLIYILVNREMSGGVK